MRILVIGPHPTTQPPIPLLVKRMVNGLEQLGCKVETVHYGRHRLGESLKTKVVERSLEAGKMLPLLRRSHFDAVILNTSHDWRALLRDLPLILTLKLNHVPYTFIYHGTVATKLLSGSGIKHGLYKGMFGLRLRLAAGVFVLAWSEEQALRQLWPKCGVATVRLPFVPMSRQKTVVTKKAKNVEPKILYVGRLIREKGSLDLLHAFRAVAATKSCQLQIVGDGPVAQEARSLAQELGIQDRVTFAGHLDQEAVSEALNSADLFVFPTYYSEGFPVAILEAMGAGLPVVTTRVAGLVDWLEEGKNAHFVQPKEPAALAEQIVMLLGDEKLRRRMGRANRDLVKSFEPVAAMNEYLEHIQQWARPGRQGEDAASEPAPMASEKAGTI